METITILDSLRLIIGVTILAYASYTDIKTRMASNYLWVIMGLLGAILLLTHYFLVGFENIYMLAFIPIMIVLVYVFFQLRLIFGGADAKALMALAILVPIQPNINELPMWGQSLMPGVWQVFSNSIILFLFIPLSLLVINILKRNFSLPHMFLGYKMKISTAKEKFVWPLEKIVEGKRKFVYMPKEFDIDKELNEFEKNKFDEIWVTPKIPFMIPLLGGFIVTFFFGDILFYLMNVLI